MQHGWHDQHLIFITVPQYSILRRSLSINPISVCLMPFPFSYLKTTFSVAHYDMVEVPSLDAFVWLVLGMGHCIAGPLQCCSPQQLLIVGRDMVLMGKVACSNFSENHDSSNIFHLIRTQIFPIEYHQSFVCSNFLRNH